MPRSGGAGSDLLFMVMVGGRVAEWMDFRRRDMGG